MTKNCSSVVLLLHMVKEILIKGTRQRCESLSADCVFNSVIIVGAVWGDEVYYICGVQRLLLLLFLSVGGIITFSCRISAVDSEL